MNEEDDRYLEALEPPPPVEVDGPDKIYVPEAEALRGLPSPPTPALPRAGDELPWLDMLEGE